MDLIHEIKTLPRNVISSVKATLNNFRGNKTRTQPGPNLPPNAVVEKDGKRTIERKTLEELADAEKDPKVAAMFRNGIPEYTFRARLVEVEEEIFSLERLEETATTYTQLAILKREQLDLRRKILKNKLK